MAKTTSKGKKTATKKPAVKKPAPTKPAAKDKPAPAPPPPSKEARRPTRGMTYDMWAAFDAHEDGLTIETAESWCEERHWPRPLLRSHFKQWQAAGGKGAVPAPPPPKAKVKREQAQQQEHESEAAEPAAKGVPRLVRREDIPPPPRPVRPDVPQRICNKCGGEENMKLIRCNWCSSKESLRALRKGEKLPQRIFMAVADYGWGMGLREEDAVANMLRVRARGKPNGVTVAYELWDCPRTAAVDKHGKIIYRSEGDDKVKPPRLLRNCQVHTGGQA